MLRELHISNLAVIADARIELAAGLNCFTGATGAGKSLVIGALEVLLGLRSPAEMLRAGADEGRVSGVFEIDNPELLQLHRAGDRRAVTADGGELLLTRRLYASAAESRSALTATRSRSACSSRWPSTWSTCTGSTTTSTCSSRRTSSTCSTSSATCGRFGSSTTMSMTRLQ